MAILIKQCKKLTNSYINVNGEKKKVLSILVNKNGAPTKVFETDGNGLFIAIYTDGSKFSRIQSKDGISWEEIAIPNTSPAIAFGKGKFVTFKNRIALYSEDGINWIEGGTVPSDVQTLYFPNRMVFTNERFISFRTYFSSMPLIYSEDGINWIYTGYKPPHYVFDIVFGDNKYVAVGSSSNRPYISYSTDGISWTNKSLYSVSGNRLLEIRSVAYGNGKFVAVASRGDGYNGGGIFYSEDGINWTYIAQIDNEYFYQLYSITFANGKFVVGGNYYTYFSEDGVNWTRNSDQLYSNMSASAIAYGNNKFVTTGKYNPLYSGDGINWTLGSIPSTLTNNSIVYTELAYGKFK